MTHALYEHARENLEVRSSLQNAEAAIGIERQGPSLQQESPKATKKAPSTSAWRSPTWRCDTRPDVDQPLSVQLHHVLPNARHANSSAGVCEGHPDLEGGTRKASGLHYVCRPFQHWLELLSTRFAACLLLEEPRQKPWTC